MCLATPAPAFAAGPADFAGVHATDGARLKRASDRDRRLNAFAAQNQGRLRIARVWFYWSEIETEPGRFDFTRYDALVEDAARNGLRLLPVLIDPPGWRTSAPPGPQRGTYPPARPADMARFASYVVGRYGRSGTFWNERPGLRRLPVRSWQVWNEPNIWPWWGSGPDPAAYTALLRSVSAGIRRCDARAEVVAAGLPNSNVPGIKANAYAAGMYAAGAEGSFDSLALHSYGTTPGNVVGQVESLRDAIALRGDDAPIWVTEFGWGTGGPPSSLYATTDQQAQRVGATVEEFHARRAELGLRGFVYYQWADGFPNFTNDTVWFHVGLVGPLRQPKLAWWQMALSVDRMGLEPVAADAAGRPLPSGCRPTAAEVARPAPLIGPSAREKTDEARRPPAPRLASLKLRPTRFRAARRGPALRKVAQCGRRSACGGRFGSRLTFRASRAGMLELRVQRLRGRREVDVPGVVKYRVRSGKSALRLLGRVRGKALRRGRYAAIVQIVARDGRRSKRLSRRFTIVR